MAPADWIEFWDNQHSIYVSPRHAAAHFLRIAKDIGRYAPADGVMLDYGCGEARSADLVAEKAGRLILSEAAPNVRAMLTSRYAGHSKIEVRSPDQVAAMTAQSADAIVLHSVSQYLASAEFDALLVLFRRLLHPGGLLVIGDVIPRGLSAMDDAMELVRFGAQQGFLFAALLGLVRTYFSNYRNLRKSLGLARYDETEMVSKLNAAGFAASRAGTNIGHNAKRMTFLAHAR